MALDSINQYIKKLKSALEAEKTEDQQHYQLLIQGSSISEKKEKGVCWYPIVIKDSGYGMGDYPYLEITRPAGVSYPHFFSTGKPVKLFSNQDPKLKLDVKGTVVYANNHGMKISFNVNEMPDWVDEGKIGVDLLFDSNSYVEMDRILEDALNEKNENLNKHLNFIFDQTLQNTITEHPINKIENLNESQLKAVSAIIHNQDLVVLHGPPGTGKTTTLVQAAVKLTQNGQKLLVTAPSNAAADLLAKKLDQAGVNTLRIGNPAKIDPELMHLTIEGKLFDNDQAKAIKKIRKQADEYRRMAGKYKREYGRAEREQKKLLLAEAKKCMQDAIKIEDYEGESLQEKAQAIVCTLVVAANKSIRNIKFDTVIIDEAGQALQPAALIPLSKAPRAVLAGDHLQLPPTVKSDRAIKLGLDKSLMEQVLNSMPKTYLLDTQYRMHPDIAEFSSNYFYDGKLKSAQPLTLDLGAAITFIDTSGCSFDEELDQVSRSYFNSEEAKFIVRHIEENIAQHPLVSTLSKAIISPYKEQTIKLEQMLPKDWEIDTVDSFQGNEKDVIYISLVRSNTESKIGFLRDVRRMNVALTRAKHQLVVVGDASTLANDPFYAQFIQYCEDHGFYKTAWEWM